MSQPRQPRRYEPHADPRFRGMFVYSLPGLVIVLALDLLLTLAGFPVSRTGLLLRWLMLGPIAMVAGHLVAKRIWPDTAARLFAPRQSRSRPR